MTCGFVPCTMVSVYFMFFIFWAWHAHVVDLNIVIGDIIYSWTTSTSACDLECLLLLDGLHCMLWSQLGIEDVPILDTKVFVLIMESFFLVWNLIRVNKQVRTCVQRSHDRLRNLVVRILFIISMIYTTLPNFLNRMVMKMLFFSVRWFSQVGKCFSMVVRILKRIYVIPLSLRLGS